MSLKLSFVVGTRPELIKLWPVFREALQRGHNARILLTGQHTDLVDSLLEPFGIPEDRICRLQTAPCCPPLEYSGLIGWYAFQVQRHAEKWPADAVIVQGDTNSALGGAQGGFYAKKPVVHVEAGLRSGNRQHPWPEETNRMVISRFSAHHFAPTAGDRWNLIQERVSPDEITVTGNTGIDALRLALQLQRPEPAYLALPIRESRPVVVVTAHRHENREQGIAVIAEAAQRFVEETGAYVIWPRHPHPVVMEILHTYREHINFCDPIAYPDFVRVLRACDLIVTDSGGLQEEACYLQKPMIVCRETTERKNSPLLVAPRNPSTLVTAMHEALRRYPLQIADHYGDGYAAVRIVSAIGNKVCKGCG